MKDEMADDLDVDAMLEAPYKKEDDLTANNTSVDADSKQNGHSKSRKDRDSSRDRDKDRSKRRSRSRDRDRDRDRHATRRHPSKSRDRKRSKSRDRQSRSRDRRSKDRDVRRSRDKVDRPRDKHRKPSKERQRSKDRKRSKSRSRDRKRSKSRSKDKKRSKSRSRDRKRSRSRDKKRSRSKSRDRKKLRATRSRSRDRRRRHRSGSRRSRNRSTSHEIHIENKRQLTAEERDARTVFCMQLSARIKARELEEFFSVVGKVTDVRIITDAKTRRSKGIAYVEFEDVESVPLALGLAGQKLLSVPIVVQPTLAERNRAANINNPDHGTKPGSGPMRLYVGSLHFNITEEMLKGIFEPFGKIDVIQLIMDSETGRSKGYGFVTFHNSEDAKKALEQLNGFELAGRPMKVNHVTDRNENSQGNSLLDLDEKERTGVELGATQRLQLMAKLAEGTGLQLPPAAVNALHMPAQSLQQSTPPIATQCFLLSNMFDPSSEQAPNWANEIRDDVIQECNKHGGVLHVFVDKQSAQGNVYVKCPSIATAAASVNALHGRWFAGKMITAAYVPVMSYHSLFPDAMTALHLLPLGM
ncbi:Splicing factor RBM39-like [Trinorchestia longiramus]|nr:Splicing factor RBM39-like [Trinorchestia longiramus]